MSRRREGRRVGPVAVPAAPPRAARGAVVSGRSLWRAEGRSLGEKGWAPARYWAMWGFGLTIAVTLFYVILTPIWIGLRVLAWLAEFKARRRR